MSESREDLVSLGSQTEDKTMEEILEFQKKDDEIDVTDVVLTQTEKKFLLTAERGDCATVREIIQKHKDQPEEFNIDCVDPLMRSALISAIENENVELIKLLLEEGIQVKVNIALETVNGVAVNGRIITYTYRLLLLLWFCL